MSPKQDVLGKGDALAAALANAQAFYAEASLRRVSADTDERNAADTLRGVRAAQAGGRATDDDVQAAEMWLEECCHDRRQQDGAVNAALEKVRCIERQARALLRAHPDAFAEQAEAATQAALASLRATAKPMRDSLALYEAADRAWAPLCRAVGVQGVPPWPLVHPDDLEHAERFAPRPAAFDIDGPEAAWSPLPGRVAPPYTPPYR
jgi:hypothetical protein